MLHLPSRNFLVIAHPRTGTNLLCNTIANRKDANYLGEYYPDQSQGNYNVIEQLFYGEPDGLKWGRYNLREKVVVPTRRGLYAKTFYFLYAWPTEKKDEPRWDIVNNIKEDTIREATHWDLPKYVKRHGIGVTVRWDLFEYIKKKRIGVLHLRRKNLVDTALSLMLARRENNYIYTPYKNNAIEVTPSFMAEHLWMIEWQTEVVQSALDQLGVHRLDLWYEDMVADPQTAADRVADYLQRPRMKAVITKPTVKQRLGRQRDYILHYDKLKARFAGSHYEQFFTD